MAKGIRQLLALLAVGAVFLVTVAAVGPGIVGGGPAPQSYPWAAALLQTPSGAYFCAGSLIAPTWVLTAAHCVAGIRRASDLTVRVGSNDRSRGGSASTARQLVVEPDYVPSGQTRDDAALVQLRIPASQPLIPLAAGAPATGDQLRLLGWGQTCPTRGCDSGSTQLEQLDVQVVDASRYGPMDPATELCVLGAQGQGPGFGDSGGPAILQTNGAWLLAGATSRGPSPYTTGAGAVYTSVAAYSDWIDQVTGL